MLGGLGFGSRITPTILAIAAVVVLLASLPIGGAGHVQPPIGPPGGHASKSGALADRATLLLNDARASLAAGGMPSAGLASLDLVPRAQSSPGIGQAASLAYDPADGYVLAVAPNVTYTPNGSVWGPSVDTWTFAGGNWTQLSTPIAPPNRGYASMAYDSTDGYVVVFGGVWFGGPYGFAGYANDTWSFRGGNWTNLTTSVNPGHRGYSPMTWDASDGYAVLVEGMGNLGNNTGNLSSTWTFVNGTWTAGPLAPLLQSQGTLGYDAADGYVVYFGGAYSFGSTSDETWKYHSGAWTSLTATIASPPTSRANGAMTFDTGLNALLLFGGITESGGRWTYLNDTWTYANLSWTRLSGSSGPAPREQAQLVFDAADNVSLLFGGVNYSSGAYSDTWAFGTGGNGSIYGPIGHAGSANWSQAAPHVHVSTKVIDIGMSIVVDLLGVQGSAPSYSYSGLPPGCTSADTAQLVCAPNATGTFAIYVTVQSSSGISSAASQVTVLPTPSISAFSVSPTLTEVGGALTVQVTPSGGQPPMTFNYSGLPAGCSSLNVSNFTCTVRAPGIDTIAVKVSDVFGAAVTASATVQVIAAPALGPVTAEPAVIDVGQITTISATVTAGLSPYSFGFSGLPPGCLTSTASRVACAPTSAGQFVVNATVTDRLGFSTWAIGTVTVNSDPSISRLAANSTNVTVGAGFSLSVTAAGGTGPLSFDWAGLPAGCPTTNASVLNCTSGTAGNYSIVVTVTDAVGVSDSSQITVEVVNAPIFPTPGRPSNPGGSTNASSTTSPTTIFLIGLIVGLCAFAVGAAGLARRSRLAREGQALVEGLRRLPPVDRTTDPRSKVLPPPGPPSDSTAGAGDPRR